MITPISTTYLELYMTGTVDIYSCGMGVAYCSTLYTIKNVTQVWWIFAMVTGSPAVWQRGHRQFLDGHRL